MCFVPVNGAWPIHCVPSPPIWVRPATLPLPFWWSRTIVWQPIPSPTVASSGASVERLCGQPEQKNGVRAGAPSTPPRGSVPSRPRPALGRGRLERAQPRLDGVDADLAAAQAVADRARHLVGVGPAFAQAGHA